jgi:hypothetical protein
VEFDLLHKELEASIRGGTNLLRQTTKVGRAGDTVVDKSSAFLCSFTTSARIHSLSSYRFSLTYHPGLIHAYVRKILGIMDAHFEQNEPIRMPSDQEMMHQQAQSCCAGTTDLGPVAAAVDGFVVRISGPAQPEG